MLANPTKGNGQTNRPMTPSHETPPTPHLRVDQAARHAMIEQEAYYAAERRGFKGGSAQDDWLAAEIKIDEVLG